MTIVAFCPVEDAVYVDQKHSWDDGLHTLESKVHLTPDSRYTYACAGTVTDPLAQVALELLRAGVTFRAVDEHFSRLVRGTEILIRDNDTRVVYYAYSNSQHVVVEKNTAVIAIGSGANVFRALRLTQPGTSTLDIMHTVAQFVPTCGGKIEQF